MPLWIPPWVSRRCLVLPSLLAGLIPLAADAGEHDCVLEPRATVDVRAASEGLIDQVLVDRGDRIRTGQVLIVLDAGLEKAAFDLARYRATMVGVVESAEGRVEFAALKLRRRDKLADGQFISLQDRDEAAAEKRLAEAELVQARENQQVAAFEQTRAGEQLRLRTIKSPLTGVVTDRLVHPGDLADNRDIRKPLLRVADISVLHVEALLPVAAYGRIAVGATLEVLLDPPGGGRYPAKVRTIDPLIDLASGTFRVRLALPNPDFKFPAGLTCRVEVPTVERGAGSLAATRSRAAHAP